jgi:hypothetical protein
MKRLSLDDIVFEYKSEKIKINEKELRKIIRDEIKKYLKENLVVW